jgi:hypothetical protein
LIVVCMQMSMIVCTEGSIGVMRMALPLRATSDESLGDQQFESEILGAVLAGDRLAERALAEPRRRLHRAADPLHEHRRPEHWARPLGRLELDANRTARL